MDKANQLQEHDQAYQDFVALVESLTPEQFLQQRGGWAPRDVVAHLIGWNRNIRLGCDEIRAGRVPFYHADAANDYRKFNAEFMQRYSARDIRPLLEELRLASQSLREYFESVDAQDWSRDFGPQHYRGGAATIGRCAESIAREYVEHGQEIAAGLQRGA